MDNKALFEKLSKNRRLLANQLLSPAVAGFWRMVIDKYSEKAHFLFELLQNADDAKATYVRVLLGGTGIYFIHNGSVPFTVTDPDLEGIDAPIGHLNSLTSVGCSSKLNSESVIGKFGIGFKSVFQYTNHPHIEDDNFSFSLVDFIVPIADSRIENVRRSGETLFYLPFSNPEQAYSEILSSLDKMVSPLFFLKHLESFEWVSEVSGSCKIFTKKVLKSDCFLGLNSLEIKHSIVSLDSVFYHYFSTMIERDSQTFDCSIVYASNQNYGFEPIYSDKNVYCFFPTEELLSGFPFLLHAPFLLTENRERIKRNEDWNKHLLSILALVANSILLYEPFRNSRSYNHFCDLFPLKYASKDCFISNPFLDVFKSLLSSASIIKADDGMYLSCDKVLFCNNQDFTKLFASLPCSVFGLQDLSWGYSFLYELSVADRNRCIELLKHLELIPNLLSVEYLLEHLDTSFLSSQSSVWLIDFYKFLTRHKSLCTSVLIRKKEFVLCDDGIFRAVYSNANTPQVFLKTDVADCSVDGLYFAGPILSSSEMLSFCSAIGIDKPSEATYIEKTLLPKYINGEAHRNDIQALAVDMVRLANYYSSIAYTNEEKERFLGLIDSIPFLPSVVNGINCFSIAEVVYFYSDDLQNYFKFAENIAYLDQQLILKIDAGCREKVYYFLHSLGVAFYPRIKSLIRKPNSVVLDELDLHPVSLRARDNGGQVIEDKVIDGFTYFLNHWSKDSSMAFYRLLGRMIGESGAFSFKTMLQGHYSYYEKGRKTETVSLIFKTTAYRYLFESSWLPSSSNQKIKLAEIMSCDDLNADCMLSDIDFHTLQFLGIRYDVSLANLSETQRHEITLIARLRKQGYTDKDLNALIEGTASIVYREELE